uniref:Probable protein-export membrane protein SecG n=1 Tax=Sargassum hemiphyllum var. chinense TaxID=425012 RepID=A0A7G9XKS4_SARHM|nr:Ycf47 [Sargassum hemiphyllum var. chinense]QPZ94155.1 hypothetical chloroplast RF47 [Sargassum hemiphyllum var. chinense]
MKFISIISILVNFFLILIILIRSPNEQSLQENLDPFKIFESSSKAENSIDNLIKILTIIYFSIALAYNIKNYL